MKRKITIVHISDLHVDSNMDKEEILNALTESLQNNENLHADHSGLFADFLVVSGDIAQAGSESKNFKDAERFINAWYKALGLDLIDKRELVNRGAEEGKPNIKTRLIMCPGNHDIDRGKLVSAIQTKFSDCSEFFNKMDSPNEKMFKPLLELFNEAFSEYSSCCKRLNIKGLDNWFPANNTENKQATGVTSDSGQADNEQDVVNNYLFGFRAFDEPKVRFNVFNTAFIALGDAWLEALGLEDKLLKSIYSSPATVNGMVLREIYSNFSREQKGLMKYIGSPDYGMLRLGHYITEQFRRYIVGQGEKKDEYLNVGVMHHPPSWLDWQQRDIKFKGRDKEPPFDTIARHSNFILHGHEHTGSDNTWINYKNHCPVISAGAAQTTDWVSKNTLWSCNYSILTINRAKNTVEKDTYFSEVDGLGKYKFNNLSKPQIGNVGVSKPVLQKIPYMEDLTIPEIRLSETIYRAKSIIESERGSGSSKLCNCTVGTQECFNSVCYRSYANSSLLLNLDDLSKDTCTSCVKIDEIVDSKDNVLYKLFSVDKKLVNTLALNSNGVSIKYSEGLHFIEIQKDVHKHFDNLTLLTSNGGRSKLIAAICKSIDQAYKRRDTVTTQDSKGSKIRFSDTILFTLSMDFYVDPKNYTVKNGKIRNKEVVMKFEGLISEVLNDPDGSFVMDDIVFPSGKFDSLSSAELLDVKYDLRKIQFSGINIVENIRIFDVYNNHSNYVKH